MCEKFDGFCEAGTKLLSPDHRDVADDGHMQQAVVYQRVSAGGLECAVARVEQQNALRRFAEEGSYDVARRYEKSDGVESADAALL